MYGSTRNVPKGNYCAAAIVLLAIGFSVDATGQQGTVQTQYVSHATEHFRITHYDEPVKARLVGDVLEQTYALVDAALRELFFDPATPAAAMDWMCFSDRNRFEAYAAENDRADVSNLNGYYSPRSGRVVLYWGTPSFAQEFGVQPAVVDAQLASALPEGQPAGSLTSKPLLPIVVHESVHQIAYSRNLQERGRRYPLWFTEGLALYLERSLDAQPEREPDDWTAMLVRLRDSGELVSLSEFALVSEVTYSDLRRIRPLYAQAFGAFAFLAETRRDALLRYMDSLRGTHRLAPLRLDEFERAFGDPDQLDREWSAWLARLTR